MVVPKVLARVRDGKIRFWKESSGGQDRRPEPREDAGAVAQARAAPPWARLWVWREGGDLGSEREEQLWDWK